MTMTYSPTDIMRQFLFVREEGANRGPRVEAIQKWSYGVPGDSWCCELATMALDICFQGLSPIPRLRACQSVYDIAKNKNMLVDTPQKDDIFIYVNDSDHAHHIGFITDDKGLVGIAGNTSADGKSSNGDRVAEHGISKGPHVKYIRYTK